MDQKNNRELNPKEVEYLDAGIEIEINLSQAFTIYKIIFGNRPSKEWIHVPNDYGYFYEHIRGKEWYEKLSRTHVNMRVSASQYDRWAKASGLFLLGVAIEHSEKYLNKIRKRGTKAENLKHTNSVKKIKKMYNALKHNGFKVPTEISDADISAKSLIKDFSFNLGDDLLANFDMGASSVQAYVYFMDSISNIFDQDPPLYVDSNRILRVLNLFHQE